MDYSDPPEPFGPDYPNLGPGVAKFRRIKNPTPEQRRAHGQAVGAAIRALNKRAAQQRDATRLPPIYVGSEAERAAKLRAANLASHRAALTRNLPQREPKQIEREYVRALDEKAKAIASGNADAFAGLPPVHMSVARPKP